MHRMHTSARVAKPRFVSALRRGPRDNNYDGSDTRTAENCAALRIISSRTRARARDRLPERACINICHNSQLARERGEFARISVSNSYGDNYNDSNCSLEALINIHRKRNGNREPDRCICTSSRAQHRRFTNSVIHLRFP
jgi:hypothetical protein